MRFLAKKGMKMKHITATKDTIIVFLYPYLSLTIPLMKRPRISPIFAPLERPACHGAGI
jgi:hypothetical protein